MVLRPARADDYPAFALLFPELESGDVTPPLDRWAQEMVPGTIVAEDGYVLAYAFAETLGDTGYVRQVVVGPEARGRGVGRALMDALAARFRAAGLSRWCLNVKPDNAPARRLYGSVGLGFRYESHAFRLGWDIVARLPAASAEARVVSPGEDAAVEAAMGLYAGQLGEGRSRGRVPIALHGRGVVGAALFNRDFPGAFPFRVASPALAAPLLEAIRAHRRPEHDFVQVVVEDDPALASMLRLHGAAPRMHILHYAGELA